jgi:hypothetical protein
VDAYLDGHIPISSGSGLCIELDWDLVQTYADLYRSEGTDFSFPGGDVPTAAPALPKR